MAKPLLCMIGFHQTFKDTVGKNVGSEKRPIYILNTYETCNRCGWSTRPKG